MKIKVIVIYGGISSEKTISEKTGKAVIKALSEIDELEVKGYYLDEKNIYELHNENFDVAFIALHGKYGEDGTLQGYLEMLGKKYCGSGVMTSSVCMSKVFSKYIFLANSILTPDFICADKNDYEKKIPDFMPAVIKPDTEGSSIGMYIVNNKTEYLEKIKESLKYSDRILAEKYIKGREFTVAVIEMKNSIKALPVIEIRPGNNFFDFESKYVKGKTEYIVPALIDSELELKLKKLSEKIFRIMGCRDFARIDFMTDSENNVYALEVNTIPGMTETSLLPKAAAAAGIEFKDLLYNFILNRVEGKCI